MASKNDFLELERDNAVDELSVLQIETVAEGDYVRPELYEDEWAF